MTDHGGDWAGFAEAYGSTPLDFSANVSPLGTPEPVRRAAEAALAEAGRYPDPLCRALREKLAAYHGVPADWILCGSGAADLIYRLAAARRPGRALVTAPTFSEYENALTLWECRVSRFPLYEKNGFAVTEDILTAIVPGLDLLFLCEPNNPTGRTTPKPLLLSILDRCRETGTLLVADECFGGFLDDPAAHTLAGLCSAYPNLLILKAFTKLYALAGLRLGYCLCSSGQLLEAMRRTGQPWAVSAPAQAAGIAALGETEYVRRTRAVIQTERPRLAAGLRDLGFQVVPGEANYLLFSSSAPLLEPLRERGILLRSCGNYSGLDGSWYRTAVRTAAENQRLLTALRDIRKEGNR